MPHTPPAPLARCAMPKPPAPNAPAWSCCGALWIQAKETLMSNDNSQNNDTWAVVELMGHITLGGRITKPGDYGGLWQIDVPEGDTFRTAELLQFEPGSTGNDHAGGSGERSRTSANRRVRISDL